MRKLLRGLLGVSLAVMLLLGGYYVTDRTDWLERSSDKRNVEIESESSVMESQGIDNAPDIETEEQSAVVSEPEGDETFVSIAEEPSPRADSISEVPAEPEPVAYQSDDLQRMQGSGREASEDDSNLTAGHTGDAYQFDTRYYPYYGMLNEPGQNLYRQVYANAMEVNAEFMAVETVTAEQLTFVMSAVYNDHPELFWLDTQYYYTYTASGVVRAISLVFNSTTDNLPVSRQNYDAQLAKLVAEAAAYPTAVEKEKYVHDYILQKCTYDLQAPLNQSSYSALVNGVSVCAGYARAMQHALIELGIPCYYCTGIAQGGDHAWNIVYLEDGYYHVDLSWNDNLSETYGTMAYLYFNLTDGEISQDHVRTDMAVYLPACHGQVYSYGNLYGMTALEALQNAQYSSYESLGYTAADIIVDISQYNDYARNYLIATGGGEQTFALVLQNKELLDAVYTSIQTESYAEAYMQEVIDTLAITSSTVRVSLSARQLQNGYILMQQTTWIQ